MRPLFLIALPACSEQTNPAGAPLCEFDITDPSLAVDDTTTLGFSASQVLAAIEGTADVDVTAIVGKGQPEGELHASFQSGVVDIGQFSGPNGSCIDGPVMAISSDATLTMTSGWFVASGPVTIYAAGVSPSDIHILGNLEVQPSTELSEEAAAHAQETCSESPGEELRFALPALQGSWERDRGVLEIDFCDGSATDSLYAFHVAPGSK